MIRCPKCKAINIRNLNNSFFCDSCSNAWSPDINAKKLFQEWAELDKTDRLIAQTMKPGGAYTVQSVDWDKVQRRADIAKELKEKHQGNLDLSPDIWYQIFSDTH